MAGVRDRGLLSVGVFLVLLVVCIILSTPLDLIPWSLIPPLVIALFGCWTVFLAAIKVSNPVKYERTPFSTFAWGLLLIAVGGAWFVASFHWIYSLAVILLVLGMLAIATALRRK